MDLQRNSIGAEGGKTIAEALHVNASLTKVLAFFAPPPQRPRCSPGLLTLPSSTFPQLVLSSNALCGIQLFGGGTYTVEGITAIAGALRVNASLTSVLAFPTSNPLPNSSLPPSLSSTLFQLLLTHLDYPLTHRSLISA